MNESKNIERDYYIDLQIQQQEILQSQELNLKILNENHQEVEEEIIRSQIILQENVKVIKFYFKTIWSFLKFLIKNRQKRICKSCERK